MAKIEHLNDCKECLQSIAHNKNIHCILRMKDGKEYPTISSIVTTQLNCTLYIDKNFHGGKYDK